MVPDPLHEVKPLMRKLASLDAGALLVPKPTLDRLLKEAGEQRDHIALVSNIAPETARELASGKQAAALIETVKAFVAPTVSAAS